MLPSFAFSIPFLVNLACDTPTCLGLKGFVVVVVVACDRAVVQEGSCVKHKTSPLILDYLNIKIISSLKKLNREAQLLHAAV